MTTLAERIAAHSEPIPGYRLVARLGAGGYGEVWRVEAPGGIAKALKVIDSSQDDSRAERELAALNRIKQVRHPFLLSLERIERGDGLLLIVSELASASLKQHFDQCREQGLPGIPRDELLTHLRDTADALDYINQKYSLQHLDVKPENLLLVGERVKVADFGLVRDLIDGGTSLSGGLTPVYAPPELFEGRPNHRSDQYSLAIVFQEMLSGTLPFAGQTTAQLAAQHLHSRPNLTGLPWGDQAVVARALSKDPDDRFPSCRAMVDALSGPALAAPHQLTQRPKAVALGSVHDEQALRTEVVSWNETTSDPARRAAVLTARLAALPPAPAPTIVPAYDLDDEPTSLQPTVVIGLGGWGGAVLRALRRRWSLRYGNSERVPAWQLLLIDTDAEALKRATTRGDEGTLANDEVLLAPLRSSTDYRNDVGDRWRWLHRRWLFNIPRSLKTQGFRPLGRLAGVDHCERIQERLRRALDFAVAPANVELTTQTCGLPLAGQSPRVVVVGSINGGTGSGMVLDVGRWVQQVLAEKPNQGEDIVALLAHGLAAHDGPHDMALANALACLSELNHAQSSSGSEPPTSRAQAFTHPYVVHLGEQLELADFERVAERIAAYIDADVATTARRFFVRCRSSSTAAGGGAGLRSIGIAGLGYSSADLPTPAVDDLCAEVVSRWRSPPVAGLRPASLAEPNTLLTAQRQIRQPERELFPAVDAALAAAGLANESMLVDELHRHLLCELGATPHEYLERFIADLVEAGEAPSRGECPTNESVLDALEALVGDESDLVARRVCLTTAVAEQVAARAEVRGRELVGWLTELILRPELRLRGAQGTADVLSERLRECHRQLSEQRAACRRKIADLEQGWRTSRTAQPILRHPTWWSRRKVLIDSSLFNLFELRLEELAHHGAARQVGLVLTQIAAADEQLRNLGADLNRLVEEFSLDSVAQAAWLSQADRHDSAGVVARAFHSDRAALVGGLEQLADDELRSFLTNARENPRDLVDRLRRKARGLLAAQLRGLTHRNLITATVSSTGDERLSLTDAARQATPMLDDCGGTRQWLLVADQREAAALLKTVTDAMPERPTFAKDTASDVLICCEAANLSLPHLTAKILGGRVEHAQLAERLHTRQDVTWPEIVPLPS